MRRTLAVLAAVLIAGPAFAAKPFEDEPHRIQREIEEPEPWKEGSYQLPPYPEEKHLVEVDVAPPGTPFTFAIDRENLNVGADNVVRYTIVITSRTGASNVLFEGIQCASPLYVTYAYGDGAGGFREASAPEWRVISGKGTESYRKFLREDYFCDVTNTNLTLDRIRQRFKYPVRDSGPDRIPAWFRGQ